MRLIQQQSTTSLWYYHTCTMVDVAVNQVEPMLLSYEKAITLATCTLNELQHLWISRGKRSL